MSTEPRERRNILEMDQEITRLRRVEKSDRASKDRLRGQLIEAQKRIEALENGLVEWKDDGKQAGRTILRLRASLKSAKAQKCTDMDCPARMTKERRKK